jgi:hypothetical protein
MINKPEGNSPDEWIAPPPVAQPTAPPPAGWRRWPQSRRTMVIAVVLGAALVGGGIAVAVNHASGSSGTSNSGTQATPPPSLTPSMSTPPTGGQGDVGQGTLTAVGASSVTVKSLTGKTTTYQIGSSTEIKRNGIKATLDQLKVGDPVSFRLMPGTGGTPMLMGVNDGTMNGMPSGHSSGHR